MPTRGVRSAVTVFSAIVLIGAGSVTAVNTIDDAGEVDTVAERIVTTGDGLLFPIDPVPVCEVFNNFGGYSKTFGSGGHQGVDIGARIGQEVYAVDDGILEEQLFEASGSAAGNGWKLRVWSPTDGEAQYRYYHLDGFADGLQEGDSVTRGQVIGYVGDTGNATPGGWHLHFEVRPGPALRYGSQPAVDPVPLLDVPSICNVYPKR